MADRPDLRFSEVVDFAGHADDCEWSTDYGWRCASSCPKAAVPSGSAGEPTPTTAEIGKARARVLHWFPAVNQLHDKALGDLLEFERLVRGAVAAAATAQAVEALQARAARCREEDIAETYHLAADCVRALAGGAPQQSEGTRDAQQ
jgi:hypothetical protein